MEGKLTFYTEKRFQDIAFFHIEKPAPPPKKSNPLAVAAAGAFAAVILVGIGYCAGLKAGWVEPPCCLPLDLGFDFDFEF